MRPTVNLQRSVSRMTLDLHRAIKSREHAADYYAMAEREQQFQYDVSGTIGFLPVETVLVVKFDILFLFEYGNRRDSQLQEPLVRFGYSNLSAPAGTVPYAHLQSWKQDADFNFTGCKLIVGAHNPTVAIMGTSQITSLSYTATLHASFQGFGTPIDPDDMHDGVNS